jgi:hypothetical protein
VLIYQFIKRRLDSGSKKFHISREMAQSVTRTCTEVTKEQFGLNIIREDGIILKCLVFNLSLTKAQKIYDGEKAASSTKTAGKTG